QCPAAAIGSAPPPQSEEERRMLTASALLSSIYRIFLQGPPRRGRLRRDRINQFVINVIQPTMLKGTVRGAIGTIVLLAVRAIGDGPFSERGDAPAGGIF